MAQSNSSNNGTLGDTAVVDSINERANSFRYINLDSVDFFAKKSYALADELNYTRGRVEAIRLLSIVNSFKGEFSDGISFLFEEKLRLDPISDDEEMAILDLSIGLTYSASGNYKSGLPYLNKSLAHFRISQDIENLLNCLNYIGVCYIRLGQFDKSLSIFKEIKETNTNPTPGNRTTLMVNLGYSYYGLGKLDSAKIVLNEFFSMPKDSIDERGYGFAYFKLGEVFAREGKREEAIEAFQSSTQIFDKFKTHPDKIEAFNGLAKLYLSEGNYNEALYNADTAVKLAEESGILNFLNISLETRYKILKAQNNFEEAIKEFERFKMVSDSLIETRKSAEMGRITAQYEFNQQRNELQLKQKQAELENQNILNQQTMTIRISVVIIIAIIALLAVIYRGYNLKLKSNKLLTEKNQEIEQQRDKLEEINNVKNKLLAIIGHDLKSPLSSLNGLLYLLKNKIAEKEDLDTILPKLISNFEITSTLLSDLLNWTRSQMEGYTLEFKEFEMEALLLKVIEDSKFRLEDKNITCTLKGAPVKVYAEEKMIEIVCQNLIANAIKFCEDGGTIVIDMEVKDQVCLSFTDSGVGISTERIKILLDDDNQTSTVGTKNERGTGLGLTICKDFLKKNNSQLCIHSKKNKGSTFSFCLANAS